MPRKKTNATHYMRSLKVRGTGRFAYDMLRYDRCCPATEADSLAIAREEETEPRTIRLLRFTLKEDVGATKARWASFGWEVIEEVL